MLIGILLDISEDCLNGFVLPDDQTIFQEEIINSVLSLLKFITDFDDNDRIFVICAGGKGEAKTFDLLHGLKVIKESLSQTDQDGTYSIPLEVMPMPIKEARDLLTQSPDLLINFKPLMLGGPYLLEGLEIAKLIFCRENDNRKILFILSNGVTESSQTAASRTLFSRFCEFVIYNDFKEKGIFTVCLYINRHKIHLYKPEDNPHKKGHGAGKLFLFNICSSLPTQAIPFRILKKKGWEIDTANNETKMFLKINNPRIIKMVIDLFSEPAILAELLITTEIEKQIYQIIDNLEARNQGDFPTCFSHALAAIICIATHRIYGRDSGYPTFEDIKNAVLTKMGSINDLNKVLNDICSEYRLQHTLLRNEQEVREAVLSNRPVLVTFMLTKGNWAAFGEFYNNNPKGVLTIESLRDSYNQVILGGKTIPEKDELLGHAVVLTSFDATSLRFLNSWGTVFADGGYFRVKDSSVLSSVHGVQFYDIFWEKDKNLTKPEIKSFENYKNEFIKYFFSGAR